MAAPTGSAAPWRPQAAGTQSSTDARAALRTASDAAARSGPAVRRSVPSPAICHSRSLQAGSAGTAGMPSYRIPSSVTRSSTGRGRTAHRAARPGPQEEGLDQPTALLPDRWRPVKTVQTVLALAGGGSGSGLGPWPRSTLCRWRGRSSKRAPNGPMGRRDSAAKHGSLKGIATMTLPFRAVRMRMRAAACQQGLGPGPARPARR